MLIETNEVRISGSFKHVPLSYLDSIKILYGYVAAIRCYPQEQHVVLAEHPDEGIALVAAEDARWEEDLKREGWQILFHVSNYAKQAKVSIDTNS